MRERDPPGRTTTSTYQDTDWKRVSDNSAIVQWRYSIACLALLTRSSSAVTLAASLVTLLNGQGHAAERPKHVSSIDTKKNCRPPMYDGKYVFVWCVHLRLPYVCVMIFVLLIPACLFYLTRTVGRNRHAVCGSPMSVGNTYIQTYIV